MKKGGRKLSQKEIFFMVALLLILCILAYNQFFDKMIEERIETEQSRQALIQTELKLVNAKISELQTCKAELARVQDLDAYIIMPSYNAENLENNFLNTVFTENFYSSLQFASPYRTGDQVRRTVTAKFETDSYEHVEQIIRQIAKCNIRCLIDEIRLSEGRQLNASWEMTEDYNYQVTIKFTFYETMWDGIVDALLKGK